MAVGLRVIGWNLERSFIMTSSLVLYSVQSITTNMLAMSAFRIIMSGWVFNCFAASARDLVSTRLSLQPQIFVASDLSWIALSGLMAIKLRCWYLSKESYRSPNSRCLWCFMKLDFM